MEAGKEISEGRVDADFIPAASLRFESPIDAPAADAGSMSLGANIVPVENLAESLQVAFDAGAKRLLLPMARRWVCSKGSDPLRRLARSAQGGKRASTDSVGKAPFHRSRETGFTALSGPTPNAPSAP